MPALTTTPGMRIEACPVSRDLEGTVGRRRGDAGTSAMLGQGSARMRSIAPVDAGDADVDAGDAEARGEAATSQLFALEFVAGSGCCGLGGAKRRGASSAV